MPIFCLKSQSAHNFFKNSHQVKIYSYFLFIFEAIFYIGYDMLNFLTSYFIYIQYVSGFKSPQNATVKAKKPTPVSHQLIILSAIVIPGVLLLCCCIGIIFCKRNRNIKKVQGTATSILKTLTCWSTSLAAYFSSNPNNYSWQNTENIDCKWWLI